MRFTVIALAMAAALAGCGQKAKDEFAGISYGAKQADLETAGFTCREEAKTEFTCVNLNWKGTAFGQQVRKATFIRHDPAGRTTVSVEMADVPRGAGDIKILQRDIDQVCQRDSRWDMWGSEMVAMAWNCPGGSFLKFLYITAGGGLSAQASLSSDSPQ